MSVSLLPVPKAQFFTNQGLPLAGGKVYIAQPGTVAGPSQISPKASYTDFSAHVTNPNPVVLDASGRAGIWVDGYCALAVYDATGGLIYTADNISSANAFVSTTVPNFFDATTAPITHDLKGLTDYSAVKTDNSANTVTLIDTGGNTFPGGLTYYTLTAPGQSVRLTLSSGVWYASYFTTAASPNAVATQAQLQANTSFTTTGAAPAYVLTPSPSIASLVTNRTRLNVTAHAAGTTGSNTITISGLGPFNLKQYGAAGVKQPAVITSGMNFDVISDGADIIVLNPLYPGDIFTDRVYNGGMVVSQRIGSDPQTFTAGAALAYCVDRFYGYCTGVNVTGQQIGGPSANTSRYRFTGNTANTGVGFGTRLESRNTYDIAGATAAFQVKLKSSSLTAITWTAYYANATDNFGSLAAPNKIQIATGTFTISSTETQQSVNIAIPSAATTGIEIVLTTAPLALGQTLTIGDFRFEKGVVANPFVSRPFTLELSLCQRYFQTSVMTLLGYANSASSVGATVNNPVRMRDIPTYAQITNNIDLVQSNCSTTTSTVFVDSLRTTIYRVASGAGMIQFSESYSLSAEL